MSLTPASDFQNQTRSSTSVFWGFPVIKTAERKMWKGSTLTSGYAAKSLKLANRSLFWETRFLPVAPGSSFWDVFQVAKDLGFHCKDFGGKNLPLLLSTSLLWIRNFAWLQLWAYKFYLRCSIHIKFQLNSESYCYSWVVKFKVFSLSYKGPNSFSTPATPPLIPCAICLIQALRVVMSLYICSCHDLCHSFPSRIPTLGWLLLLLNFLQSFISLWNISYTTQPFQPCHTIPIIYAVFQLHTFWAYSKNFTNFNAHMISKSTFTFT